MDTPDEQADTSMQLGVTRVSARRISHETCQYCGARLAANYYFCPVCATPYKSPESMTAHIKPVPLTEGELIARRAPQAITLFWAYAAVILASGVFCEVFFQEKDRALTLVLQTVAMFVTTCIFASMYWKSLDVQFKRIGFDHPAAWIGLLALAPLLGINYAYFSFLKSVGAKVMPRPELSAAAVLFFFCICPAVLEEIAFRGLVQHWLTAAIRPIRALLLASVLFMALHGSIVSAPYLLAVGVLLGWTKWKTGSLYPSMAIHLLHNWIVLEFM